MMMGEDLWKDAQAMLDDEKIELNNFFSENSNEH